MPKVKRLSCMQLIPNLLAMEASLKSYKHRLLNWIFSDISVPGYCLIFARNAREPEQQFTFRIHGIPHAAVPIMLLCKCGRLSSYMHQYLKWGSITFQLSFFYAWHTIPYVPVPIILLWKCGMWLSSYKTSTVKVRSITFQLSFLFHSNRFISQV